MFGRLAQPVRAPALQAGGPQFDPVTAHHSNQSDTDHTTCEGGWACHFGGPPHEVGNTLLAARSCIMVWLQPAPGPRPRKAARGRNPHEAHLAIERFLNASRKPVLIEPGDDALALTPGSFAVTPHPGFVSIECWNQSRNLVRRVINVKLERPGRLELEVEHFGGHQGRVTLVDLDRAQHRDAALRGSRLKYRERFRQSLQRQFPGWRIAELSTEPDLHHSLSPVFPRAFLTKGRAAMAAIGAAEDSIAPDRVLSFGLIWLDYLRRREPGLYVETLSIFMPAGLEHTTCHRVRYLNACAAKYLVYVHDGSGWETLVQPNDYTNLDTNLDTCHASLAHTPAQVVEWVNRLCKQDGVQRRNRPDGSVSLAVHGVEFARADGVSLSFGLDHKHVASNEAHIAEIEALATGLTQMRDPGRADPRSPMYVTHSEAWLESLIRENTEAIDAMLRRDPIYGQVPQWAAGERGIIDLLAVDYRGRLAVVEIKASEDIHLPLQALDYWMRVKWHLEREEFSAKGYFPGVPLAPVAPRLLLVAPALDWHPTNESVLRFIDPSVPIERLGVGIEWRRDLKVVFRK